MNTIIKNSLVWLLLICVTAIHAQSHQTQIGIGAEWNRSVKELSLREIQEAVYETRDVDREYLMGSKIPLVRDSADMKRVTISPAFYVDSLFYENPFVGVPLEYPELILKRFPYVIMSNSLAADKIIIIMDSLALEKPEITAEEYWQILKRDYTELINENFKWFNKSNEWLQEKGPLLTVWQLRAFRQILAIHHVTDKKLPSKGKPYLEKLGVNVDELDFSVTQQKMMHIIERW